MDIYHSEAYWIYNHPIGSIYHLYIPLIVLANWVIICYRSHLLREPGFTPSRWTPWIPEVRCGDWAAPSRRLHVAWRKWMGNGFGWFGKVGESTQFRNYVYIYIYFDLLNFVMKFHEASILRRSEALSSPLPRWRHDWMSAFASKMCWDSSSYWDCWMIRSAILRANSKKRFKYTTWSAKIATL